MFLMEKFRNPPPPNYYIKNKIKKLIGKDGNECIAKIGPFLLAWISIIMSMFHL